MTTRPHAPRQPRGALADLARLLGTGRTLAVAFAEQNACMRRVHRMAGDLVRSPQGTPPGLEVRLDPLPNAFLEARKNLFSTLFHALYVVLDLPKPRRLLYGQLNYLFRIWVTCADNLLDGEDKVVLPVRLPGSSRVMREVVTLMAADRILARLLDEAVAAGTLGPREATVLSRETLRYLLPSAAQEATEEGGIHHRPSPETVVERVHVLKTGLLFNVPFLGLDVVEGTLDRPRLERLKAAFRTFGGGCQLLDDVRDLARDLAEGRQNYVLSVLARDNPSALEELERHRAAPGERLHGRVLPVALEAAGRGLRDLTEACRVWREEGLLAGEDSVTRIPWTILKALDLEDMKHALSGTP